MRIPDNLQHAAVAVLTSASVFFSNLAVTEAAGQVEVFTSPATINLDAQHSATLSFGIVACDRLVAPAIEGTVLANELLTEAVLRIAPDGTVSFTYSDLFRRDFRGRRQYLAHPGDELEDLLRLPDGHPRPKVLLDLYEVPAEVLILDTFSDVLFWAGDLIYRFDLGQPLRSLELATRDASHRTTVVPGPEAPVEVLASADGATWVEIWTSPDQPVLTEIDAAVPAELLGSSTLYLKFRGTESALVELYISGELDASTLATAVTVAAGANTLVFSDDQSSSHRALIFTSDPEIGVLGPVISYPGEQALVVDNSTSIRVLFPEEVGIELARPTGQGITGIGGLFVGQRPVLSETPCVQQSSAVLAVFDEWASPGVSDWAAYLAQRQANDNEWPSRGQREVHNQDLALWLYQGYQVIDDRVELTLQSPTDPEAVLTWVVAPMAQEIAGRQYRGVGWKVRLEGMEAAATLQMVEPVVVHPDHWAFQQTWGHWLESLLGDVPFDVGRGTYLAEKQPFYFSGGPTGSVLSYFETPAPVQVAVTETAARHFVTLELLLGQGQDRETPGRLWLCCDEPLESLWAAVDEWTVAFDTVAGTYQRALGLATTEPTPFLEMPFPDPDYFERWRESPPPLEQSWLYTYANKLPEIAAAGFRALLVVAWESDADHPAQDYLPGAGSWGSGNAPWQLEISAALGGEEALEFLNQRADALGITIVLWTTPGHLSNSSPLLVEHPDWIMWSRDGTPEVAGWGDIVGVGLSTGYLEYSLGRLEQVSRSTGVHGILFDSFLTFGAVTDYGPSQPLSQLGFTLEIEQMLDGLDYSRIDIEGCGLLGLSSGGFPGPETLLPDAPPDDAAMAALWIERIRGHEYGFYRYRADEIIDPDSYYRALAAKGIAGAPHSFEIFQALPVEQRERIIQANRDYLAVTGRMERRHLVAEGGTWKGVSWTRELADGEVLFSFSSFVYPVEEGALIEDITAATSWIASEPFSTEKWHTYTIHPKTRETSPRRPSGRRGRTQGRPAG